MNDNNLLDVVELCLRIERKACDIYAELADDPHNEILHAFWQTMAQEEQHHVAFWKEAANLARAGLLPPVIDDIPRTKAQLVDIMNKVGEMKARYTSLPSMSNALMLAYRLELFMLHEAFEAIFSSLPEIGNIKSPAAVYEKHIQGLVHVLVRQGSGHPEIELLGETLAQLWKKNRELVRQLSLDELTGIYNRRGFFNACKPIIHLARRNDQPVGVMMLDIDDFKLVNDTHGHQKGDEVLEQVARALQGGVRASDVLGRYGGEEFIVLFSSIKESYIYQLAEKMRNILIEKSADQIPVTASIGISAGKLDANVEECLMAMIKEADDCLYASKNSGKNRVSFCTITKDCDQK